MRLRARLLIISVLIALPVSAAAVMVVNWRRAHDEATTIERLADASITQHVKDACETDPDWFLAGPREAPPSLAERALPDAETRVARPSTSELPIEFYAYTEDFEPGSTAAPRFPPELRSQLRSVTAAGVHGALSSFSTRDGAGVQYARLTGWSPGPCAVLLFRIRPWPHRTLESMALFAAAFAACLVVAGVVAWPMSYRISRLATAARESARSEYGGMVPVSGHDEIGALGAMFNEAAADIRRRSTDARDREEALRRYVADVTDGVAAPLAELEAALVAPAAGANDTATRADVVTRAHGLAMRLLNLAAAARLRTSRDRLARDPIDMNALVTRLVDERAALARVLGVTVTAALPPAPAVINGDPVLLERAIGNLVDNAIVYNAPGGRVTIEIAQYERHGRFSLRVTNTGPGVSDAEFTGLTAIRRFRGDEGRERRPGVPGLGLAVAREVAERFGFGLELRRPAAGGFEAEFAGTGNQP